MENEQCLFREEEINIRKRRLEIELKLACVGAVQTVRMANKFSSCDQVDAYNSHPSSTDITEST
ncbi:hypothetical protein, partial [Streptococcus dysgalactiae]|uniref:hypothetical protein n=1 Tax=Streptococcus dysgalactiae TaxID=1334 RepID=UPI0019502A13